MSYSKVIQWVLKLFTCLCGPVTILYTSNIQVPLLRAFIILFHNRSGLIKSSTVTRNIAIKAFVSVPSPQKETKRVCDNTAFRFVCSHYGVLTN